MPQEPTYGDTMFGIACEVVASGFRHFRYNLQRWVSWVTLSGRWKLDTYPLSVGNWK